MKKRLVGIVGAATLGVLTLSSIGLAKKSVDPAEGLSYQLTVTSVELPLGVWDRHGRFVTDLTKDDFEIREHGKKVSVDSFALVQMGSKSAGETSSGRTDCRSHFLRCRRPFSGPSGHRERYAAPVLPDVPAPGSRAQEEGAVLQD